MASSKNVFKWIFSKIFRRKYIIITLPGHYSWRNENLVMALRDIPKHGVHKNDIGGSVEGYRNLSQFGNAWVAEHGIVRGKARVSGNAIVRSNAEVFGHARIKGNAIVYGRAKVYDHAQVKGSAEIYCQASVSQHAKVKDRAYVHGDALLYGNCIVSGNSLIRENARICDMAVVHDSDISGDTPSRNDAHVGGRRIRDKIIFN